MCGDVQIGLWFITHDYKIVKISHNSGIFLNDLDVRTILDPRTKTTRLYFIECGTWREHICFVSFDES